MLEENVDVEPGVGVCAFVACFLLQFLYLCMHVTDGVSECSATLDDSVSEEEEGSFDELTDVTPYLQPGVELSALNKVRRKLLPRWNTLKHLQKYA